MMIVGVELVWEGVGCGVDFHRRMESRASGRSQHFCVVRKVFL